MKNKVFRPLYRLAFIAFCLLLLGSIWFASSMGKLPSFISIACSIALTLLALWLAIYDIWFKE